jgi:hypothetical protein
MTSSLEATSGVDTHGRPRHAARAGQEVVRVFVDFEVAVPRLLRWIAAGMINAERSFGRRNVHAVAQ